MKLSAPVYHLKRKAKRLSREAGIPLHAALDRIAGQEGFKSWNLLASRLPAHISAHGIHARLQPGDMVLVGARPGHGKTLLSLEILIEAMKTGRRGLFFSLEYNERDIAKRFQALGVDYGRFGASFTFDNSDAISASYIIDRMRDAPAGTFAVIDYLQILDQNREKPGLMAQITALEAFARQKAVTFVCIAQIDRAFDADTGTCPGPEDVRLPNPLDLSLFSKAVFLNNVDVRLMNGIRGG